MQLTDQEIIEARKRALENNPRSYEPWYETVTFGREVERLVQAKYWRDFSEEKPHVEGFYATIIDHPVQTGDIYVMNAHWSNMLNGFVGFPGARDVMQNVLFFKPMKEFVQELNIPTT